MLFTLLCIFLFNCPINFTWVPAICQVLYWGNSSKQILCPTKTPYFHVGNKTIDKQANNIKISDGDNEYEGIKEASDMLSIEWSGRHSMGMMGRRGWKEGTRLPSQAITCHSVLPSYLSTSKISPLSFLIPPSLLLLLFFFFFWYLMSSCCCV